MKKIILALGVISMFAISFISCANPANNQSSNNQSENKFPIPDGIYSVVSMVQDGKTTEVTDELKGGMPGAYFSIVNGQGFVVMKNKQKNYEEYQNSKVTFKEDNTATIFMPNSSVEDTTVNGTWSYKNQVLTITMTMEGKTGSSNYKREADPFVRKINGFRKL